jgi:FixJ family two-component response regulator
MDPFTAISTERTARANRPLVVIVDDDPAVLNSLAFSLGVDGFAVALFHDGSELLRGPSPDCACIVLDYRLPDMNGLDLADRLRARGVDAPMILITSDPAPRVLRRASAAGVRVIEKPLVDGDLQDAIRATVR